MITDTLKCIVRLSGFVIALGGSGLMQNAQAQSGDVSKGSALFATHCAECHSMKEGKSKKGPSLYATFGSKAGQHEGFAYSDALKNSQLVWNTETLSRYLASPKTAVPGGKMKYDGLENAKDRTDLMAYLATQGK